MPSPAPLKILPRLAKRYYTTNKPSFVLALRGDTVPRGEYIITKQISKTSDESPRCLTHLFSTLIVDSFFQLQDLSFLLHQFKVADIFLLQVGSLGFNLPPQFEYLSLLLQYKHLWRKLVDGAFHMIY